MWPLIKNNYRLILARKGSFFVLVVLPVILFSVALLNNATSQARLNIGLVDQDQTVLSRELASFMARDGNRVTPTREDEVDQRILSSKEELVAIIPAGFEAAFLQGQKPEITLRTLKGQEVTGSLKAGLDIYLSSLAQLRKIKQPADAQALADAMREANDTGFRFSLQRITQGNVNNALSFASGFLFYVLAMSMMQGTSLILEEKHWNTLSRVRQAPVGRSSYIIANFLTAALFLAVNLLSLFLVAAFLFRVETSLAMYLLWFYYGLIWIVFGIFLSLVVKSRAVYASVVPIVTTVLAMLGGSFWPLWLMPPFMQKLAMITPHYWANDAMMILQKGQSLLAQRTDLLALTGFLMLFFALGVFALRRANSAETFV